MRARYYDARIGRFVSEDSYWGEGIDPLSLNLYTYCLNNSVNLIDPSGHLSDEYMLRKAYDLPVNITTYKGNVVDRVYQAWLATCPIDRMSNNITWVPDQMMIRLAYMHQMQRIDITKLTLSQLDSIYLEEYNDRISQIAAGLSAIAIGPEIYSWITSKQVKTEIIGKPHASEQHKAFTMDEVKKLVSKGKYTKIYINRALKTAGYYG